jgi:hypothetical protein
MAIWNYGPEHDWFAWHPVWTPVGWKWLVMMRRYRVYLGSSMPGTAEWWSYKMPSAAEENSNV